MGKTNVLGRQIGKIKKKGGKMGIWPGFAYGFGLMLSFWIQLVSGSGQI